MYALQAKECQELLGATGERHGMDSPLEPPLGTNPADTLILGFSPSEL